MANPAQREHIQYYNRRQGGGFNRRITFRTYSQCLTIMGDPFLSSGLSAHIIQRLQEFNTLGVPGPSNLRVASHPPCMLSPSDP